MPNPVESENPTFGSVIKGLRMGYGWSDLIKGHMRITDDLNSFFIELIPAGRPELFTKTERHHRVWWTDDKEDIIKSSSVLSSIKKVKSQLNFYLNQNGDLEQRRTHD